MPQGSLPLPPQLRYISARGLRQLHNIMPCDMEARPSKNRIGLGAPAWAVVDAAGRESSPALHEQEPALVTVAGPVSSQFHLEPMIKIRMDSFVLSFPVVGDRRFVVGDP